MLAERIAMAIIFGGMEPKPIIISPKTKEEEKILKFLFNRMGLASHSLTTEEVEDMGLALAMAEVDRSKFADPEKIKNILRS